GLQVYGFVGVFLGPVILAILFSFVEIYREQYRPPAALATPAGDAESRDRRAASRLAPAPLRGRRRRSAAALPAAPRATDSRLDPATCCRASHPNRRQHALLRSGDRANRT